jgi:hypothetical protein
MQKTEIIPLSVTLDQYQLKVMKDFKTRLKTLKLVQERAGNTLDFIVIGNYFLKRTQMAQKLRERMGNWYGTT